MKKIQDTSKLINKLLSCLFWIIAIGALLSVIALAIVLFNADSIPAAMNTRITLGSYVISLSDAFNYDSQPITIVSIINIVSAAIFFCYAISIIKHIFYPMSQGLPFDCSVSKAIRKLAWVQLIYGAIDFVLECITNTILYNSLDIASLFDQSKVTSCTLSVVSDASFILWFVVLLLLSQIFKYGEQLQQLSDETL